MNRIKTSKLNKGQTNSHSYWETNKNTLFPRWACLKMTLFCIDEIRDTFYSLMNLSYYLVLSSLNHAVISRQGVHQITMFPNSQQITFITTFFRTGYSKNLVNMFFRRVLEVPGAVAEIFFGCCYGVAWISHEDALKFGISHRCSCCKIHFYYHNPRLPHAHTCLQSLSLSLP